MTSEFKYTRVLGLFTGMLLGIVLGFSFGVYELIRGDSRSAQSDIRALGLVNGSIYHLLPEIPVALFAGLLFAAIGYAIGRSLEEDKRLKSEREISEALEVTDKVWPPPPTPQKKDNP